MLIGLTQELKTQVRKDVAKGQSIRWTKHIKDPDVKAQFVERLYGYTDVLDVLKNILKEDLEESLRSGRSTENYAIPNWSEFQADKIGTQRTLVKLIDLLTLTKE